jgi:hypothetical protein
MKSAGSDRPAPCRRALFNGAELENPLVANRDKSFEHTFGYNAAENLIKTLAARMGG